MLFSIVIVIPLQIFPWKIGQGKNALALFTGVYMVFILIQFVLASDIWPGGHSVIDQKRSLTIKQPDISESVLCNFSSFSYAH